MKRIVFLVPFIVLFFSACSSESEENFTQMLGAFERHDSELNTMLDQTTENISSESNRDKALQSINEKIIPKVNDFRHTINNYTLSNDEHLEVQEAMVDYLDEVEDLMELYSNFNEKFFFVNPLSDDSIDETLNEELDKINQAEEEMDAAKKNVNQMIAESGTE